MRFRKTEARQLVGSARNLVIVSLRRNAIGIPVTENEKERKIGIRTGIATVTVTATATANGTETGTKTMIVIVTVTVIAIATATGRRTGTGTGKERGRGSETAIVIVIVIVKRTETVVRGTTVGMTTTHAGHPVTTAAIANGIGRVTRPESVATETAIGTQPEDQVRDGRTENGALGETERKIEVAMMSPERNERLMLTNEVRRYAACGFLNFSPFF